MARILIGWELGSFRGHVVRMLRYHDALVAAGHEVDLAVQRIDALAAESRIIPGRLWQAPVWPRLLAMLAQPTQVPPASLADIFRRLGLGESGVAGALLRGWDAILSAARPDVVVAEYAPLLLAAAHGRMPTVAAGGGFDLPPADMEHFPLAGTASVPDETALLGAVNSALREAARRELAALPALFTADRAFPAGLNEIDPYAGWRSAGMTPPLIDLPLPQVAPAEEEELFVYWPDQLARSQLLWQALARSALPVRLFAPRASDAERGALTAAGLMVEQRSVPSERIVQRSRLLLSHGGTGFTVNALLRGRPHVIVHSDLEKHGNGMAVDRLGLGAQMPLGAIDIDAFVAGLRALHEDAALQSRAQAFARGARQRLARSGEQLMVDAVAELA